MNPRGGGRETTGKGVVMGWMEDQQELRNRQSLVIYIYIPCLAVSCMNHSLHDKYDLLPSGRRHRMPTVRTQRVVKSCIPSRIKLLNH